MFNFFQDAESNYDSIITLDTVNKELQDKRRQTALLALLSLFFLGNRYLIDGIINFLVDDTVLNNQLSLGVYLLVATSALYFILGLVQKTSSLISQRDEIQELLVDG